MGDLFEIIQPFSEQIALIMLVIARLSFVVFFMPGVGERTVPVNLRLLLLLGLSFMMAASGVIGPLVVASPDDLLLLLAAETFIGLALGVLLRFAIWMLAIAGAVVAQSIGLSQFLGVVVETEAQTLTANLLSLAGAALLLAANFHTHVIASFATLYAEIPVGAASSIDPTHIVRQGAAALGFSLMLAWPFVVVSLIYNLSLGFINKALPQLMVAFVGAPLLTGAGLALLALSCAVILTVWKARAPDVIGWVGQ